jgi:hypothetical protein
MKFKSCDVIECCFCEDIELYEFFVEKQKECDFDLFDLLSAELEFNIRAGAVQSNIAEAIGFVGIYLSMELWDFDVFNV